MKTGIIVQVQGMHCSSEQHAAHTSGHHVADWPNQSVPGSMARLGLMVPISCGFEVVLGSHFCRMHRYPMGNMLPIVWCWQHLIMEAKLPCIRLIQCLDGARIAPGILVHVSGVGSCMVLSGCVHWHCRMPDCAGDCLF